MCQGMDAWPGASTEVQHMGGSQGVHRPRSAPHSAGIGEGLSSGGARPCSWGLTLGPQAPPLHCPGVSLLWGEWRPHQWRALS